MSSIRSSTAKRRHLPVIWLVLAGVLYRGLIPAGFMPATGEAARDGAMLMVCPHGMMGMHEHGGNGSGGASIEQCPFGAAAGPAVPGVKLVFSFAQEAAHFRPDWSAGLNRGSTPHLQPPVRGPPVLS